jgi:hypothetical protein
MPIGDHPAGRLEKGMSSKSSTHVDGVSPERLLLRSGDEIRQGPALTPDRQIRCTPSWKPAR